MTANVPTNQLASDPLAIHPLNAVYFVNSDLADLATLLAGVPQGAQVVLLDPAQDGLNQMMTALQGRTGLDAIHIIGHGSSGLIDLGSTSVTTQTLTERAQDLATLGGALSTSGDILLYGCDVAAGADGLAFVNALAQATGADVAASTDLTGAAAKGGDWGLEAQTGSVEAKNIHVDSYSDTLPVTQLGSQTVTPGQTNIVFTGNFDVLSDVLYLFGSDGDGTTWKIFYPDDSFDTWSTWTLSRFC